MKVLLDTFTFLCWAVADHPHLSKRAAATFLEPKKDLFQSVASVWEMAIKHSLGKLEVGGPRLRLLEAEMSAASIHWLPIEPRHCEAVVALPVHHRDPLIACSSRSA